MEDEFQSTVQPDEPKVELVRQVVYCGPNIPLRGLFAYQVFLGGYPGFVKDLIAEIPEIERLMCGVNDLTDMQEKVARRGTAEHLYYERIREKVSR